MKSSDSFRMWFGSGLVEECMYWGMILARTRLEFKVVLGLGGLGG